MDNEKMGQFIAELRKAQLMTQKELAEKLNVSDKAVSKWERGQSFPDIALLAPLSEVLGITTTELLNGERSNAQTVNVETSVVNALEYAGKRTKSKKKLIQNILAASLSVLLLLGIFVVTAIDLAISAGFTWSLVPISASVFAWLVCFPAVKFGLRGVIISLISLSVFILPFLFALDQAVNRLAQHTAPIFFLGSRIAPPAILFFWASFGLFRKIIADNR